MIWQLQMMQNMLVKRKRKRFNVLASFRVRILKYFEHIGVSVYAMRNHVLVLPSSNKKK